MIVSKECFSVIATQDFLFTIGGKMTNPVPFSQEGVNTSSSEYQCYYTGVCEVYAIKEDQWNTFPSLNVRRGNAASCVFSNRFLYVFGGKTDQLSQGSSDADGDIRGKISVTQSIERMD